MKFVVEKRQVPALGNHGGCPYRMFFLCIQSIDRRGGLRSKPLLGLQTGTIDFNLREVRVGAGLVPALGNHGGLPLPDVLFVYSIN